MSAVVSSDCLCYTISSLFSHSPLWSSSHGRQYSTNFSKISPCNRLELFKNCSSTGFFHMAVSCRNGLLQHMLSMESSVLPGPCSSSDSLWDCSFLQVCPLASTWSVPWPAVWISASPWCSLGYRDTAASARSSPQSAGESLTPGAPPAPFLHRRWYLQMLFLSHILTPLYQIVLCHRFFSPP